jgi:hypothetical protein
MNMYRYAANDPVNGVDPSGLSCVYGNGSTNCVGNAPGEIPNNIDVYGRAPHQNHTLFWGMGGAAPTITPPGPYSCALHAGHFGADPSNCMDPAPTPIPTPEEEPQSEGPDEETIKRNQCKLAAVASGLGNASLSATGLIPGGRAAAVVVRTGATSIQATGAILGRNATGGSLTAGGFATELGNAALGNRGGQVTLGSAGKAIAQNLPVLGTAIALVSIGNDAYNAYQAYQSCSGD